MLFLYSLLVIHSSMNISEITRHVLGSFNDMAATGPGTDRADDYQFPKYHSAMIKHIFSKETQQGS